MPTDPFELQRARVALRGALVAAVLSALGWPLDMLISAQLPHARIWPSAVIAAASALLGAGLGLFRARITVRGASLAFLANSMLVAIGLWFSNEQYAAEASRWVPFQANKLGVLTVGLLTPELSVGLLSIAAYSLSAVVQWHLFGSEVHARAAVGEPVAMLAYTLFGAGVLIQTSRRFRMEQDLLRMQHEAASLERLARTLLAVRDYANTPLQTLVMTTELLSAKHPELAAELGLQERALRRLRRLSTLFAPFESQVRWTKSDASLDLERMLLRRPLEGGEDEAAPK